MNDSHMRVNVDFDFRVVAHSSQIDWAAAPLPKVLRRRLDRIAGESSRATSFAHNEAGCRFSEHTQSDDKQFIVLDGVFQNKLATGATFSLSDSDGIKALVLDGSRIEDGNTLQENSWRRLAVGSALEAIAVPDGANLCVMSGHLIHTHVSEAS